jgi:hypothetical protein
VIDEKGTVKKETTTIGDGIEEIATTGHRLRMWTRQICSKFQILPPARNGTMISTGNKDTAPNPSGNVRRRLPTLEMGFGGSKKTSEESIGLFYPIFIIIIR